MIRKPILLFQQNELTGEQLDDLGTIEKVATVVDLGREWPMSDKLRHKLAFSKQLSPNLSCCRSVVIREAYSRSMKAQALLFAMRIVGRLFCSTKGDFDIGAIPVKLIV
jgi:hypothetical protein